MKTYRHTLAGDQTTIHALESADDAERAGRWLKEVQPRSLALDTETTGLDTFSRGHRLRTVQFGTGDTAWVVPFERGPVFQELARTVVTKCPELVIHNAAYDLLVLDRHGVAPLEQVAPRVRDTKILAHLCDSRQDFEGGVGISLKPLSAWYVDPSAPDTQAGLTQVFRSYGLTKATGWAGIPYEDETYQRYAGLDVLLAYRLRPHLERLWRELGIPETLVEFEHALMTICAGMERRGMLLDVPYTEGLVDRLEDDRAQYAEVAARYGVENVNSDRQVVAALQGMGERWEETTDGGAPSVAKDVLLPMADMNDKWERLEIRRPNPLADAVLRAKRASKWRKSYALAMLDNRDSHDRIHPKINTLGAKTGRASVSDPPLQQLPSKGWEIRRSIIAEPGMAYFSVDQSSVELVVLAALSQEPRMCQAIRDGRNLHDFTATLMFGEGFTKYQRGLAKIAGLGTSYQGGAKTLAKQTGLEVDVMRDTLTRYARAYPGIKRWARGLQAHALRNRCEIRTPSGRRLVLDRDKLYKAVAYICQSTARDTMGQALIDLEAKGLTQYLNLWVHDEVLGTAPVGDAEAIAREVAETVRMDLFGVPISTDAEVYGRTWAGGYGLPAEWAVG
ncbi:DNA polymerase I [Streptomyces phage Attoomi]|uniref:DNA polymerase I n=1 Tax=Streptomyces phage Attoomi TaxID=2059881 RepID=A0A2H5BLF8_9CAUD|nr:DNA polymerase I [Streptomyces phage Attoomi]AUG87166.1 DNA polymerase I [Streptomyces phage Attoomi]